LTQLSRILALNIALLRTELWPRTITNSYDAEIPSKYQLLLDIDDQLFPTLEAVGSEVLTETRPEPADQPWTQDETIAYNLKGHRFYALMQAVC